MVMELEGPNGPVTVKGGALLLATGRKAAGRDARPVNGRCRRGVLSVALRAAEAERQARQAKAEAIVGGILAELRPVEMSARTRERVGKLLLALHCMV
jgi:hypothetical protein